MAAPYTGPSVSLHVSITVAPENAKKFLELLKPVYDAVTAEPENIYFEVFQNPDKPGEFRFVENWNASIDWIKDVQLKKEYYKPYVAVTEPLWIKPREIDIFERLPSNEWVSLKPEHFKAAQ